MHGDIVLLLQVLWDGQIMTKTITFGQRLLIQNFLVKTFNSVLLNRVNHLLEACIPDLCLDQSDYGLGNDATTTACRARIRITLGRVGCSAADPKPDKPSLSMETTLNGLDLSWSAVANARNLFYLCQCG